VADQGGDGRQPTESSVHVPTAGQLTPWPTIGPFTLEIAERPCVPGYELIEELGRGGMGVVYKARQVGLARLVALKLLLDGPHADDFQRARFHAEAEAVAQLHHANIVQIYEIGEHAGRSYLALEFVNGPTLAQVSAGKPQPPRWSAELIATVANAVHHAHQRGIIHRDLKPANVLLQVQPQTNGDDDKPQDSDMLQLRNIQPKITDFGLAKRLDRQSAYSLSRVIVGTPSYIGPEQAECDSSRIGPPTDVYALGAILYELLTGRPPFVGESTIGTLLQVVQEPPPPPGRLRPGLPRDLETICLKCLAKEPSRRYLEAADLAEDLLRFLRNKPIRARPAAWWERLYRSARRRPARLASVIAVLFSVAAASAAGWWHNRAMSLKHGTPARVFAAANPQNAADRDELEEAFLRLADRDRIDGAYARAETEYRRALALSEPPARDGVDTQGSPALAAAKVNLAYVLQQLGRPGEAEELLRQAEADCQHLLAKEPSDATAKWLLARCINNRAVILQKTGRAGDAEAAYHRSMDLQERLAVESPDNPDYSQSLAVAYANFGTVLQGLGNWTAAEENFRRSISLLQALLAKQPSALDLRHGLAAAQNQFGAFLQNRGRTSEAAEYHQRAMETLSQLGSVTALPAPCRHELARTHYNLGVLWQAAGHSNDAERSYRLAAGLLDALRAENSAVADYQRDYDMVQKALKTLRL
jgi:eukaryotic-like serine/threonine-protein kinase